MTILKLEIRRTLVAFMALLLMAVAAVSKEYRVEDVPNVQLTD